MGGGLGAIWGLFSCTMLTASHWHVSTLSTVALLFFLAAIEFESSRRNATEGRMLLSILVAMMHWRCHLARAFYIGTFKSISSSRESKDMAGMQGILFDLLCDLVIRWREVFSDFSFSPCVVDILLGLVKKIVKASTLIFTM
jgi:hypothetical protein